MNICRLSFEAKVFRGSDNEDACFDLVVVSEDRFGDVTELWTPFNDFPSSMSPLWFDWKPAGEVLLRRSALCIDEDFEGEPTGVSAGDVG